MMYEGEEYTVKVKSARFFNLTRESTIKERAALLFSARAEVTSVERPTMMQYYLVHLHLLQNMTEYEVAETVRKTMNAEGFDNAEVLAITRGNESTNILAEAAKEAAKGATPLLDPVSSWIFKIVVMLALGLLGYGLIISSRRRNA